MVKAPTQGAAEGPIIPLLRISPLILQCTGIEILLLGGPRPKPQRGHSLGHISTRIKSLGDTLITVWHLYIVQTNE